MLLRIHRLLDFIKVQWEILKDYGRATDASLDAYNHHGWGVMAGRC